MERCSLIRKIYKRYEIRWWNVARSYNNKEQLTIRVKGGFKRYDKTM